MDNKKSILYKAVYPITQGENVKCIKPTINEKIVYNMEDVDEYGKNRKLHKEIPWSSEEVEQDSWKSVEYYVEKVGIGRFTKRRFRPYERGTNVNLSQKRRKFKKISQEEINKKYESNYKIKKLLT